MEKNKRRKRREQVLDERDELQQKVDTALRSTEGLTFREFNAMQHEIVGVSETVAWYISNLETLGRVRRSTNAFHYVPTMKQIVVRLRTLLLENTDPTLPWVGEAHALLGEAWHQT